MTRRDFRDYIGGSGFDLWSTVIMSVTAFLVAGILEFVVWPSMNSAIVVVVAAPPPVHRTPSW